MALKNKVPRPQKESHSPRFGPPPGPGEFYLGSRSTDEKPKKKSKRQEEQEALDAHMKQWEENFEKDNEERKKLLDELPF